MYPVSLTSKARNFVPIFQPCRWLRSQAATKTLRATLYKPDRSQTKVPRPKVSTQVSVNVDSPPQPTVQNEYVEEYTKKYEAEFAAQQRSVEVSKGTIRLTKQDVIDQDLYEGLCNQCDMEESASPLLLACKRFTRPPLVLSILECALSFCRMERLTFEEQSVILHHVATYAGNQSLLFGAELRTACGFVQGMIKEYNQTQLMKTVWALTELLGADSHTTHLLSHVASRTWHEADYLGGEQLLLLAKSLWILRQDKQVVLKLHDALLKGIFRKMDAATPDQIVETLHILHEIKPIAAVNKEQAGRLSRALRRDIRTISTDNISKAAMLFAKVGYRPEKGDIMVSKLVDEFVCRVPLLSTKEFLPQFCAMVAGCDFLQRQIVGCLRRLYQCISLSDSQEIILLASALASQRIRHNSNLSLARAALGEKVMQNVEEYDSRTSSLLLHNFMHMRWRDEFLPLLLATRAFSAGTLLSLDEMCALIYDYSLIKHPEFGIAEMFCQFVATCDIGQQILSWAAGVRLARGMLNLRFNHHDWLMALHRFVTTYLDRLLSGNHTAELSSILDCLFLLNSPSEKLIKRLLSPLKRDVLDKLSLHIKARVFLSAYAIGYTSHGWCPDVNQLTYRDLAEFSPARRYWLFVAWLAGEGEWQMNADLLSWLRADQFVALPRFHFFNEWLGDVFVAQHIDLEGSFPQHNLLLADHSRHLVPWTHLQGWQQLRSTGKVTVGELTALCQSQSMQPISVVATWHRDYLRGRSELSGLDKSYLRILKAQGFQTLVVNVDELLDSGDNWQDRLEQIVAENQWMVPTQSKLCST
eukprot:scpid50117/ scgid15884/ 